MDLVIGATGHLGTEICRQLTEKGAIVRALIRETSDPYKVELLQSLGVELVNGNVRAPMSLKAACQGATTVISTVTAMPFAYEPELNNIQGVDHDGTIALIDAARQTGVSHFVYTSFSSGIDLEFPLNNAKRTVEKYLRESGLTYTILRPSYLMETWLTPIMCFDPANARAQLYGTGEQPISWISLVDIAKIAVESLENPAARNNTIEIGGPEALTPLQVVNIFEYAVGRKFELTYVPVEVLQDLLTQATDPMQKSFGGLMLCYSNGDRIDMVDTLKKFPITLTSVQQYAESLRVLA